jgi:hypothetical protein
MLRSLWLRKVSRALLARSSSHRSCRCLHTRPRLSLEPLEDRTLLSAPVTDTTGLISAITSANTAGGSTTITLASGTTFDFTTANNSTDGGNALPVITANITILGSGDTIERIGSSTFRLFDVASGGSLDLQNVTLSGGSVSGTGGGIYNSGNLRVSGSTLSGNSAGGGGGGIYNNGSLTISDSILSGNSADIGGGGIVNTTLGSLTVSDSILSGNSAHLGGGVFNSGIVTVSDSTLSGNSAGNGGGGIFSSGSLTISDSTLSGNSAGNGGGGIVNTTLGTLTVNNSTLYGNSAGYGGGGIVNSGSLTVNNGTLYDNSATSGGGIYVNDGSVTLHNTLVAGSTGGDVQGTLASSSDYNLIGDGDGMTGISNGSNSNQVGTSSNPIDPLLAPLGNYGGPTQTLALLPGSPAIDAGSSAYGGRTDQRGEPRVGSTDIGAFESQGFLLSVTSGTNQSTPINAAFPNPLIVTVTANNADEPVAGGQINFTAPGGGPGAAFRPANPVTIAADGTASVTATANGTIGSYNVTANTAGAAGPVTFSLVNQGLLKLSVSDAGGAYNGNPFAATAAAVDANTNLPVSGSFSFDYFDNTTSTDLGSTAPSNVGNYKVTATFTSSDPNYASGGQVSTTFSGVSAATTTSLSHILIFPQGDFAEELLTATVRSAGGTVNGGIVSFNVDGHIFLAPVQNGQTTDIAIVPLVLVEMPQSISLLYTPADSNFAASSTATATALLSMLDAQDFSFVLFNSDGSQTVGRIFNGVPMDLFFNAQGQFTGFAFGILPSLP